MSGADERLGGQDSHCARKIRNIQLLN